MKVYKILFCFFTKIEKKKEKKEIVVIKRQYSFYQIRNIKSRYQGLMLRFSSNDPNQRCYLNGMWTCGPSVLILFQRFQGQFSFNEKLHFTQCCCLTRDFELKKLLQKIRVLKIRSTFKMFKVPTLNKKKKEKNNTKKWK